MRWDRVSELRSSVSTGHRGAEPAPEPAPLPGLFLVFLLIRGVARLAALDFPVMMLSAWLPRVRGAFRDPQTSPTHCYLSYARRFSFLPAPWGRCWVLC